MSDALILGIIIPSITAVSAWVTIWLNGRVAARLAAQIAQAKDKIEGLESKVEVYHKAVNGGFGKLLETTKELATAKEKARGEEEKK